LASHCRADQVRVSVCSRYLGPKTAKQLKIQCAYVFFGGCGQPPLPSYLPQTLNSFPDKLYRLGDRLWQEVLSIPSRAAFTCANQPWLEQKLLQPRYEQAIAQHCPLLDDLGPEDQTIVEALDSCGLYVTHLDELNLADTDALWHDGQAVTHCLAELAQTPLYKGKHTLTAQAQHFMDHPALFRWAMSGRLLRIAQHYFRLPVAYDGPSFYYSVGDGTHRGPRRWHRDKEDWKMLKVAIYFTDVDATGGPFQCALPSVNDYLIQQSDQRYRVLSHLDIAPHLPPSFRQAEREKPWYYNCTGRAGTVIFCDTARYYHRGCPPVTQDRSAVFYSFFSRRPKHPFFCGRSPLSPQQIRQLSEPIPEPLRHCLTWPRSLHPLAKLIPKNRVRV